MLIPLCCWLGGFSDCPRTRSENEVTIAKAAIETAMRRENLLGRRLGVARSSEGKDTQANFLTRGEGLQLPKPLVAVP